MTSSRLLILLLIFVIVGAIIAFLAFRWFTDGDSRSNQVIFRWLTDPSSHPELITPGGVACNEAPFILPSEGFIGLLWNDPARPYNNRRRHSGIDIFGSGAPGTVPIFAAHDGFLTRLPDWKSTVIIRHDDPLQPGRTIWTYYTHMASRDGNEDYIVDAFPPGTGDMPVKQGTLLGYQGEYSGTGPGIAMHLHFSIVTSDDAGVFKNEAILSNTLDPTPYLKLSVNHADNPIFPIRC